MVHCYLFFVYRVMVHEQMVQCLIESIVHLREWNLCILDFPKTDKVGVRVRACARVNVCVGVFVVREWINKKKKCLDKYILSYHMYLNILYNIVRSMIQK